MKTCRFSKDLADRIRRAGVVATLTIDDSNDAVPLAKALLEGGIDCLELTLRTKTALDAIRRIRAELPDVLVGAGTVLTPAQVSECVEAGTAFAVAPGMNRRVVEEARQAGLSFAPGVCTPSDIEQALEAGCTLLKFFPCEPSGGLPYLKSMAAPYMHLGVNFIPLGGIDAGNAEKYLKEAYIPALGGSWLAPRDVIHRKDWGTITRNAREATDIVKRLRGTNA
jgi:2-dehydro-3-deoxyphosphogluconate aldolase/(4S)-4-hydroxy-2-oxoglutarate aldolase